MSKSDGMTKRRFLWLAAAGAGTLVGGAALTGRSAAAVETSGEIARRPLGRTGETVSLIGVGGFHIGSPGEDEGVRIVRTALDAGVNFLDNCWDYHGGGSEERMGRALRDGYRAKAFLMTKIDGRTKEAAARQIDESLRRLQTDHVDLMQFHEIIRMDDPERIFAPGGAMEAMRDARKAGKVRYIGFTGHKSPGIHLRMLETAAAHDFRFDAVQMPLNVMDAHFDSFEKMVVPVLVRAGIGVIGMKPMGGGFIVKEPTGVSAGECLRYAMSLPTSTVITGCESMKILDQALGAARGFRPLSAAATASLLARTAPIAQKGEFEHYKIDSRFDGTTANPQWLG
ncbi:MAG: aldo/keto reductase [Terrimicrobiaceae bacterium]|nr:aldo/keto reductase [Terrimicrobiaceae bacterium]